MAPKIYLVTARETEYKFLCVEADSFEEALEKARDTLYDSPDWQYGDGHAEFEYLQVEDTETGEDRQVGA